MNKKITCFEFCILIYFITRSTSLGMAINSYIHIGGTDGYLSPIIGMIFGLIPLFIFIKILNYKPDLNIFQKIDNIFGKKIGTIINAILFITIIFLVTIIFWNLLNFIGSQYLYKTPNLYIAIIFGISIYYLCIRNLIVTIRVANILFYISVTIFIICVLGLIPHSKIDNLLPFMEYGIKGTFISGLSHIAYSVLPLFLLLMIPKNNIKDTKNLSKMIIFFYIISNIGKAIVCYFTISVFGIEIAKLYEFPDFALLRRISTTGFFQRFESILATQWIFDLFIMISLCINYIKCCYTHITKSNNVKIMLGILILLICIISGNYLFSSNTEGELFILNKLPIILYLTLFIIPLIITINIKKSN